MEEFKKPERMIIDAIPYLTEIMGKGLVKDLQENEIICPVCHGTGLAIDDNVYGLKNDPDKSQHFPYKHQSIISCRNCYNGILKVCKHCGKPLNRNEYRCECDGAKAERQVEQDRKEQEYFEKATKMTLKEYQEKYPNNMIAYGDEFYKDIDDLLEDLYDNYDELFEFPEYVWGTKRLRTEIDPESAMERALEDSYEDAEFGVKAEGELCEFINNWNDKYGIDYYVESNVVVMLPEELRQEFLKDCINNK